jgi:hypothetical protein
LQSHRRLHRFSKVTGTLDNFPSHNSNSVKEKGEDYYVRYFLPVIGSLMTELSETIIGSGPELLDSWNGKLKTARNFQKED